MRVLSSSEVLTVRHSITYNVVEANEVVEAAHVKFITAMWLLYHHVTAKSGGPPVLVLLVLPHPCAVCTYPNV